MLVRTAHPRQQKGEAFLHWLLSSTDQRGPHRGWLPRTTRLHMPECPVTLLLVREPRTEKPEALEGARPGLSGHSSVKLLEVFGELITVAVTGARDGI